MANNVACLSLSPHGARAAPLPKFTGLQALRGVAAMLVVALHADEMWHLRLDPAHDMDYWNGGAAGVDIFFIISGVVMLVSSPPFLQTRDGWREFAWRRFIRIAPFYWLMTTLKILSVVAVPALALHTILQPYTIIASYLFVPIHDADGSPGTVLPVGWTLNIEVAFYAVFAAALWSGRGLFRVILPCLAVPAALSVLVTPAWPGVAVYCNAMVMEFAAGLWLGRLAMQGRRLPEGRSAAAVMLGLMLIVFVPATLPRLLSWGVPALLVVAGVLGMEGTLRRWTPAWLTACGDASYSIYLSHGFVVAGAGVAFQRFIPASWTSRTSFAATMVAACLLSAGVGLVLHWLVERPLLAGMRTLRQRGHQSATA